MNKSLLIVDDDALVAKVYSTKFTHAGFNVLVATTGELALKMLRESPADAVLLDLQLPDVAGAELLGRIRGTPGGATLPVIVFSSTYLSTSIQDAWKAGATKCLSKASCTPSQLVAIVKGVLEASQPATVSGVAPASMTSAPAAPTTSDAPTPELPPEPEADTDPAFTASLRQDLIASLPATLASIRSQLQLLNKAQDHASRSRSLEAMYHLMHALTNNASVAGLSEIARFAEAFEALLKELYEKPRHSTPSTQRTVVHAVDALGVLFSQSDLLEAGNNQRPNIMVVDDEPLSRRAILYALEKAKLTAVSLDNPQTAYETLAGSSFDLIFLDVDMPGMTGFELCTRLRALPNYRQTPVVFVTALNDFESRAQSTISGGNDLIAKPFLFVELAVKALVHALRSRLNAAKSATTKA